MIGVALLGGIGCSLAFADSALQSRCLIGILFGLVTSGIAGTLVLLRPERRRALI
jgi:Na+/H+ antiporter NhaA